MQSLAAAVRFAHLAALALLAGAFAFDYFVARPASRKSGGGNRAEVENFDCFELGLAKWSLLAVFLSGLAGFFLQTASVTGSLTPAAIWGVLIGTQSGIVWLVRAGLMLLLAARLFFPPEKSAANSPSTSGLAVAALIVMAQAFSGHAAAGEGVKLVLQILADGLHALAASVWLGGLVSFAFFLVGLRRIDHPWSKDIGKEATRRFSFLGLAAVAILIPTGLFNAWNLVGDIPPLVGTTYGKLLLTKLGLLLPLIFFAAVNLLELKPAILSTVRKRLAELNNLFIRLRRNVIAEASLGACILLIVGAMSVTPPARHIQPSWPFFFRWNWNAVKTNSKIRSQVTVGKWLAAAGLAGLGCALVNRRRRSWLAGAGLAASAYGGIVVSSALSIDAYPTTYSRPSVPYQAISVANGLGLYRDSCAVCHGISGFGDGPSGKDLKPRPAADLTAKHTAEHTVGDLFWWLNHGVRETAMPGFEQSLSEEEVWDLINFLRTLSAAEQARPMSPLAERPWLVAPDFVYRTAQVEGEALKDHRGRNSVLLVLFAAPHPQQRLEELANVYEKFRSLGVEVLAIPREQEQRNNSSVRLLPVVTDGGQEIFATYALFRRSFSADGTLPDPPIPRHMEFLIDRQGYVRARWIQGEDIGWSKMENLLREIDRLNQEKPSAPAPDDHVH